MRYKLPIIGFIVGAFVIPFIVLLGLGIPHLERLSPLVAPGRMAAEPFIEARQAMVDYQDPATGEFRQILNTAVDGSIPIAYHTPPLFWIAYFGVNGLVYAGVFWIVGLALRK